MAGSLIALCGVPREALSQTFIPAEVDGYVVPAAPGGSYTVSSGTTVSNSGTGSLTSPNIDAIEINGTSSITGFTNQGTLTSLLTNGAPGFNFALSIDSSVLTGGVVNQGTMQGYHAGIFITGSTITGGISNSGQISGILISSGSVDSITNTGVILPPFTTSSANNYNLASVYNNGTIGSFTNNASIVGSNAIGASWGIFNDYAGSISLLTNSGTISGTNQGKGGIFNDGHITSIVNRSGATLGVVGASSGFGIENAGTIGSISNTGLITGQFAGLYSSGSITSIVNNAGGVITGQYGIELQGGTVSGGIKNAGSITGTGATGILLVSGASVSGAIANSGTISGSYIGIEVSGNSILSGGISNSGTITGSHAGIEIFGSSSLAGGISNTGSVSGTNAGIVVDATSTLSGDITNSGTIAGGTNALLLSNTTGAFTVHNSGVLEGAVNLGINSLDLTGNSARVIGDTSGTAASSVSVQGAFASEGMFTVGAFSISPGGAFTMNNDVTATGAGTLFTNSGKLIVSAGSAPTITGNYVQTGLYSLGIANADSYGKVTITGNAVFAGTYGFAILPGSTPTRGETYTAILSAASISGFSTKTGSFTSTGDIYDYLVVEEGSLAALDLTITSERPVSTYLATVLANHNPAAVGAATVLDAAAANSTPAFAGVVSTLNGLTGHVQSDAISQVLPALAGAASLATLDAQRSFYQIVQARQSAERGLSSGSDFAVDQDLWIKGFGAWTTQHDVSDVSGFKINTGGLAVGGDHALSPSANVGLVLAFGNSGVDSNSSDAPSSVRVDEYQFGLYGDYALNPTLNVNVQADAGFNRNRESRNLDAFSGTVGVTGPTANASYESLTEHVGAGIRAVYAIDSKTDFQPEIRIDYASVQSKSYQESGAGVLNLSVGSQTYRELVIGADFRFDRALTDSMKLSANIGAGYNTLDNQVQITSTFAGGGPSFVTKGLHISPWLTNAGIGLEGQLSQNARLTVRYDVQSSTTGYLNQMASIKLRVSF